MVLVRFCGSYKTLKTTVEHTNILPLLFLLCGGGYSLTQFSRHIYQIVMFIDDTIKSGIYISTPIVYSTIVPTISQYDIISRKKERKLCKIRRLFYSYVELA